MGDLRAEHAPFNSPLETGLRALAVLEAMYPRTCDLRELTWYDHLVVFTADIAGRDGQPVPDSLHPALPGREDGISVRRSIVEQSLRLLQRVHLVEERHEADGIRFLAGDGAPDFLDTLQAPYTQRLKARARWLAARLEGLTSEEVAAVVDQSVGLLRIQFSSPEGERG